MGRRLYIWDVSSICIIAYGIHSNVVLAAFVEFYDYPAFPQPNLCSYIN
jgi:hypothetical protein